MSTIPSEAIDWLANGTTTEKRNSFDAKFGVGASAQVLNELNNPPQPDPEVEPRGWGETAWAIVSDVAEGVAESPASIASGLYEGVYAQPANLLDATTGVVKWRYASPVEMWERYQSGEDVGWMDVLGRVEGEYVSPDKVQAAMKDGTWHRLAENDPLIGVGEDTYTGKFINDASQFVGAFVGLGKVFKTGQLALSSSRAVRAGGVAAQSGAATFVGYAGNEGRITDMLLDMGVPDEVLPDFLETDPDDSEAMGRLKNVVEEGPLGALGVFAVKAFRAIKKGDEAALEAVMKEAEEAQKAISNEVNERIDLDTSPAPEPELAPQTAPETPLNGDLKPAEGPLAFPEQPTGFSMSKTHHGRLQRLAEKLNKNPDGNIKGDMGWRSHDLIDSPEAVEAEIAATARVLADEFNSVKGNPQSEQLWRMQAGKKARQLAELTGVDDQKIVETVSKFDNPRTMAAELMARENYALSLTENITQIARALRQHKDTKDFSALHELGYKSEQEAMLALIQRRELAANVIAAAQGARSNIARAMRAMQVVRKGDENLLRLISKNQGMERTADEIISAALDAPGRKAGGVLDSVVSANGKAGDMINFYRTNALLSGPGTQEVNMISNALNGIALPIQQALGATVTANPTQFLHATRTLRGIIGGARESAVSALKAGYNDEAILDPFNGKLDINEAGATGASITAKVVALPSRFLLTADEFFKQAQYRGRVFADAAAEADALKLTGQARDKHVAEYISKSFDEFGSATRGDALNQAQRSTFTENLDDDLSKMLQAAAIKSNFVRFILPFVRTPLNVLSQGFQHFPAIGLLSGRLRRDLAAGGHRRAQAIGKQVIGTSLATSAAFLAASGRITGSGPKDPRVRAQWLRTNKPYSFVTRNADGSVEFTPYQRYEPFAYPLALVADLVEVIEYTDKTSRVEAEEITAAVISVFAENTVNRTFTQGLSDLFDLLTQPERSGQKWLESQAGSFVPNVITQVVDRKELVEVRGVMDAMLSRIGMDGSLDRRRNALGEIDERYGSRMDPLGIFAKDIRPHDPVLEEITRLSQAHQSGFALPPSKIGNIDLRDVAYSGDQSMFDRWMELQSTVRIGGKTLREKLVEEIGSNSYRSLMDGNRDFTGENEKRLKGIILRYRQRAEEILMRSDDRFKAIQREFMIQKRNIKRRRPATLQEDLANATTR